MPRYLVTGAAGFLGFAIAKELASDASNDVTIVDNFVRGEDDQYYRELCAHENVTGYTMDLSYLDQVRQLPSDFDYVFHMAALNGTQNFYERPFEVVRNCTLPTMHLLEHLGSSKSIKRFLYAGTSEAYASTVTMFDWEIPTDEKVPLSIGDVYNRRWSYGASKMHGEIACINASAHYGVPVSIVRFHNAYGPRMGDKHVIPDFYNRARAGRYELFGHEDTRSFIYVDDAVRATLMVATSPATDGEVVNVGGSDEIQIAELGRIMMEVAGLEGDIILHPSPEGSVKRRAPNLEKLQRLTGFEAKWTIEEGLLKTSEFYLDRSRT